MTHAIKALDRTIVHYMSEKDWADATGDYELSQQCSDKLESLFVMRAQLLS